MIDELKAYTNKPIEFKTDLDTGLTTFVLEKNSEIKAIEQVILKFCKEPKNTSEIMEYLGLKHREHIRSAILKSMIEKHF